MTQNVDERINEGTNTQLPRVLVFEDDESWFQESIRKPFVDLADFKRFPTRTSLEQPERFNTAWAFYIADVVIEGEDERGDIIVHHSMQAMRMEMRRSVILTSGNPNVDLRSIEQEHKKNGWREFKHYISKELSDGYIERMRAAIVDMLRTGTATERITYFQDFDKWEALDRTVIANKLYDRREFDSDPGKIPGGQFTPRKLFDLWKEIENDPQERVLLDEIKAALRAEYLKIQLEGVG